MNLKQATRNQELRVQIKKGGIPSHESLMLSALMRIADACEAMVKDYKALDEKITEVKKLCEDFVSNKVRKIRVEDEKSGD